MAVSEPWQPFDMDDDDLAAYEVLVPGVPNWLRAPLLNWVETIMSSKVHGAIAPLFEAQAALRLSLYSGPTVQGWAPRIEMWPKVERLSERDLLRLVDWMLAHKPHGEWDRWPGGPSELASLLAAARSKWTVGQRGAHRGLVERVPEGVRVAVENTIQTTGTAGRLLARAWSHVHGLEPNDSAGYAEAVKAVEAAAIPVVPTNTAEPTLGTVIRQMERDGDWQLPFRQHAKAPAPEVIVAMLRTLWRGHSDRHGAEDYVDVTHEEAKAAVVLAATLVDWFAAGAISRTTSP